VLAGYNAMVWDNPSATDIRFRWGSTNVQKHTFSSDGNLTITGGINAFNASFSGIITGPTITTLNNNIATINSNISNVNNTSDMNKPVSTAQQTALDLKANINNASLTGTTTIVNLNHTGTLNSPALQTALNNYALLNSSPTFTGNVKAQVYTGGLVRYDSSVSMNFTSSTLPSTILVDGASSLALYGIPEMPIGTRFTVIKTNLQTQLYSTDPNVYFYTNRRNANWVNNILIKEDARTFIRADIINQYNGATVKVWLTESSHSYNDSNDLHAQAVGAWMLDGANFGRTAGNYRPIICSTKVFGPGNSDDGFIVNPGYTLAIYPNENYGGTPVFVNNIYEYPTPKPVHYASPSTNDMQSIKLYYGPDEIIIEGIS